MFPARSLNEFQLLHVVFRPLLAFGVVNVFRCPNQAQKNIEQIVSLARPAWPTHSK